MNKNFMASSSIANINSFISPQIGFGSGLGSISVDAIGFGNASASGGYVLYPSKPNNNMARAVYAK